MAPNTPAPITNDISLNNENPHMGSEFNPTEFNLDNAPPLTPLQKAWQLKEFNRLMGLIPHGKHKDQRGTKGAFGANRKRVRAK